ncbi:MAG TPA: DUF4232 domain-containing protein [Chloroflexia bacterium]|jgi:hypothetical protein|nr:DUF4232 domain-containing protein [Chloroflexia bacterium]
MRHARRQYRPGTAILMLLLAAAVSGCLSSAATPVPVAGTVVPVSVKDATPTPAVAAETPFPTATPPGPPALPSASAPTMVVPGTAVPAPGSTVDFTGKYFTMQVPADWGRPTDDVSGARYTMVEDSTWYWRVGQIMAGVIHAAAVQQSYSELTQPVPLNYPTSPPPEILQIGTLTAKVITDTNSPTEIHLRVLLGNPGDPPGALSYFIDCDFFNAGAGPLRDQALREFRQALLSFAPTALALASTPTAVPAPAGMPTCRAADLHVEAGWQGATGSMFGVMTVTNTGQRACFVHGRPIIKAWRINGDPAPVQQLSLPAASGNPDTPVVLAPGASAHADITWQDWRGTRASVGTIRCVLPGDTTALPVWTPIVPSPPQGSQNATPTFEVGPFEPGGL